MRSIHILLILLLLLTSSLLLASTKTAKAIILRGTVTAFSEGKKFQLKKGDWISEGTIVRTEKGSFVKLLLQDKTQLNVGPKSEMEITSIPKDAKQAGVVSLLQGQLRSVVTKNALEGEKNKEKFYIKTKTAAMGVRGTDFHVSYNPVNEATSTVTYEGEVTMVAVPQNLPIVTPAEIAKYTGSDKAVAIKEGQFSLVNRAVTDRATIPTKLNPTQFNTLRGNSELQTTTKKARGEEDKKRSITPPGLNAKEVVVENGSVDQFAGTGIVGEAAGEEKSDEKGDLPPPEGMVNKETGEIAPPAGGFIDLASADYIPPEKGATYDPNTDTYVPKGEIDPTTGEPLKPATVMGDEQYGTPNSPPDWGPLPNQPEIPDLPTDIPQPEATIPPNFNPLPTPTPSPRTEILFNVNVE